MNKKVVILQHRLLHYRVDFFEALKKRCEENSIDLQLIHGQATATELTKKDEGNIPWANRVKNLYLRLGNVDLIWQSLPENIFKSDLIILMQENRILSNYPFLFLKSFLHCKIAFWGHGANFQSKTPTGIREKWKKLMAKRVHWWFGYTQITKDLLVNLGFPETRISTLNNAVDTKKFSSDYRSISDDEVLDKRKSIGIPDNAKVGIFCGSLYKDKKLDLLLKSAEILRESLDFYLIIIGSGPELSYLEDYSANKPWIHLAGIKKGREKALYFRLADVMLNPGLLGLHILDSFSIGIPLISTLNAPHSPEIAYIINGHNGILTADNPEDYAGEVRKLCVDQDHYADIKNNAIESGNLYTIDNMVDNFFDGIVRCLNL